MTLTDAILRQLKGEIKVFVETGSYLGDGVACAISAGFEQIYSIEFYKERYEKCCERFKNINNVFLVQGNSAIELKGMINEIKRPILFWLDAHYDACHIELEYPIPLIETQPLLAELEIIKQHYIKTHTILIDDRRIFTGEYSVWHNIKEQDIIKKLKTINSDYDISFVDSKFSDKDIIVARMIL